MAHGLASAPATPSIKRQKTATGYKATSISNQTGSILAHDKGKSNEAGLGIIPETPGGADIKSARINNFPIQPSSTTKALGGHIQVPASSPLPIRITTGINSSPCLVQPKDRNNHVQKIQGTSSTRGNLHARNEAPKFLAKRLPSLTSSDSEEPLRDPSNVIVIDDESELIQGHSSDAEAENMDPDILPSSFTRNRPKLSPNARFKSIVQNSEFQGIKSNNAKSVVPGHNDSAQKYAMSSQVRSERARAVIDISLEEISDKETRKNVSRIRSIFPSLSVLAAKNALEASNGSFVHATNLLADADNSPPRVDKTTASVISLCDLEDSPPSKKQEHQMKRSLNTPTQSIRDKYSSTQTSQSKTSNNSQSVASFKQKKRLVQGRRNSPPHDASNISSPKKPPSVADYISLSDLDSEIESNIQEDGDGLEIRVLKYLNTCDASDLVELTNITKENAEVMLAARPFKSLDGARRVENTKKLKSGKKSTRTPVGDRIVDTAMDMFRGYEAIDTLVAKCDEISKPLMAEMSKWNVNIFGTRKDGELGITSLDATELHYNEDTKSSSEKAIYDVAEDEPRALARKGSKSLFLEKPKLMASDCILKDYQIVGLNWLALMSRVGLSGILADEMGLGKTCQVISFLAHLVEIGKHGPHLVVCPGSTLENWLREIKRFAPKLAFEPYHGPQKERQEMAEAILENRANINIVVTTYDMAAKKEDNKFMRRLKPDVCVYDEGHMLKNVKSQRYQGLIRIPCRFRLLLTGTPLQNNLQELVALLAFILPDMFRDLEEDLNTIFKAKATTTDSDHAALLSAQRIARARSMLTPFVLRRKKAQVLKHLPAKYCRTEYCALHKPQRDIYEGHLDQARERARARLEGAKLTKTDENNPLMQLRKAAIHPLLFRRHFDDMKIEKMADILRKKEPVNFPSSHKREHLIAEMRGGSDFWLHRWCCEYPCIAKFDIPDLAWMDSGKVESMIKLVKDYKENGDRVLLFSQFSLVLDILEAVFNTCRIDYTRIDGSTKIDERQSLIDTFRDDESITVFLLTTKAGGTGINLMYANKVIIFDGSFNPQDDKQAENRAHRVGQTREVEVVRLVTKGTVEEQILALGDSKLQLDGRVAGDEDSGKAEAAGEKAVARMLLSETDSHKVINTSTGGEINDSQEAKVEVKKSSATMRKKNTILSMLTKKEKSSTTRQKTVR
ncbi:BgTH12-05899 [Blumeria graminis f. sp. triticale]|uniref:DNA helicase n=1 Tax=Blumeria graminis f. sp. triticale TaxID=1689686 RepID=A0A9W4DLV0_BLUGR|nr:BgTH12-05899 [Blumeria graminis f. sp. triticale]